MNQAMYKNDYELEKSIKNTFSESIKDIDWIENQVQSLNLDDAEAIDILFEKAAGFRRKRLDFSLYQLAMAIKSRTHDKDFFAMKNDVLAELLETKMHLKQGYESWNCFSAAFK